MIEIRFDKTKDEVALLIWFLVDHSVYSYVNLVHVYYQRQKRLGIDHNLCRTEVYNTECSFKFILKVGV
jgi:hypothetical protein